MTKKKCDFCKASFSPYQATQLYCSPQCNQNMKSKRRTEENIAKRIGKKCLNCQADFYPKDPKALGCSFECREEIRKTRKNEKRRKPLIKKDCLHCKSPLSTTNNYHKFCSEICQWNHYREDWLSPKKEKKCKECKVKFTGTPGRKYCSEDCMCKNIRERSLAKREIKKCQICEIEFPARKDQFLCSEECGLEYKNSSRRNPPPPKDCVICEKGFQPKNRKQHTCSSECQAKYPRWKYKNNIEHRLKTKLRLIIKRAVNKIKRKQYNLSAGRLLGCTLSELKTYIENQFLPGMTWDNHSFEGWHIDHIIPIDSFNMAIKKDREKCFHFTNLQPLWAYDNLSKGAKLYPIKPELI